MQRKFLSALLLSAFVVLLFGCVKQQETVEKNELLIYCGMTMLHPMKEIASFVEQKYDCTIRFIAGGSGSLLRSIEFNKVGDLYLPGEESFIQQCREKNLLGVTRLVGYNQAALMVKKGNPLNISADICNLAKSSYSVLLGDPENSSIGRESRRILKEQCVFQEVLTNSMALVADSEDITDSIKNGVTDLSINWLAVAAWPDNRDCVEAISLGDEIAHRKKLIIGQLVYSTQSELAGHFLDYATSEAGRKIFLAYGFLKPTDLIE